MTLSTFLIIVLILILVGAIPFGRSRGWGIAPFDTIVVIVVVIGLILYLSGKL